MATDIRLKKSSVAGRIPDSSNLDYGELALNYQDGKLYYKSAGGGVNTFLDSAGVDALITSKQGTDSGDVVNIINTTVDSDFIAEHVKDLEGNITITSTDDGSSAGPELILYRNSSSPADGDYLGQIQFKGRQDGPGDEIYAKVTGKIRDATNGTEDGLIETAIKGNGSFTIVSRQRHDELQLLNGVGLSVDGTLTLGGETVDSAWVQARQVDLQRDSAFITDIIDSDYITARVTGTLDSAAVTAMIDSDYVLDRSSASFPILNEDSSLSHYQKVSFSVLTDAGGVVVLQPQVTYEDSGGNDVLININLSKGDFSDSAAVISLVDSDHVQLRQDYAYGSLTGTPTIPTLGTDFIDSAEAIKLITANAIDSSVALQLLLDSIETINLIDSSYIQLRVPETYLATIIDSDYISDRQAAGTDSSTVITLIQSTVDSAYVQAREDNAGGGGGGGGTTGSFNQISVNSYTGDSSTTAFTLSSAPVSASENSVVVTINGVTQHVNSYSLSGTTVTLDSAPETGDEIEMRVHDDYSANIQLRDYKSYIYTPSVSTTAFSGADDNGAILAYDDGKVEVFLNGSRLVTGLDYTETNSSTITLGEAIDSGDTLEIVSVAKAAIADFGVAAYDSDFLTTDADQIIHTFPAASFRTVKYIVQIEHDSDNKYHSEEILLAHNGTTVGMTTYSQVLLDSNLGTFDADISGGNVRLKFTPEYTNTSVKARAIRVNA